MRETNRRAVEPLAVRMRPRTLDEVLGQPAITGPDALLRRMLDTRVITSVILHGPPGTGKTTLAEVIARHVDAEVVRENAAQVGVKRIREIIEEAARRLGDGGRRTILFLDEIHRFSRSQQDVLLGDLETGTLVLVGATTENPTFAVNAALVSRSTVLRLEPLDETAIRTLLERAMTDERGFGGLAVRIDPDAAERLAVLSDGDARRALTALEVAVRSLDPAPRTAETTPADERVVDAALAEACLQRKLAVYDRTGEEHYDVISAFIKSMRASDEDGAMTWLARMLDAGEDPAFIARRIAIFASEDVGPADPGALPVALAAWQAVERVGMPEGRIVLAQAALHMATAPKSRRAIEAIDAALARHRESRTEQVPPHLLNRRKPSS